MTGSAQEFSIEIDLAFEGMMDNLRDVVRIIALEALKRVVMRTPVDTGRARANWQVEIGGGNFEVLTEVDKSGTVTITKGSQAIAQYKDEDGFPTITIFNNLPYIERLETGYSNQSPAGMVAITVAELQLEST